MTKKVVSFFGRKNRVTSSVAARVTPTLVTPLDLFFSFHEPHCRSEHRKLMVNCGQCYKRTNKVAVTLRKSDEKDEVDGKESQQVCVYHLVNHYNERSNDTKASEQHSPTMNQTNVHTEFT